MGKADSDRNNRRPAHLPLDGYIRVSRVGGRDKSDGFISPDVQQKAIRDWAERTGTGVVLHEPELNRSGGTMDRPIFNKIMERVRDGESGGIIVYRIDRFARNLLGALSTLAELGEYKAAFASCSEQISYVTPQERAFLQMQFVFAELVRESMREGWSVAKASAIERGIHIANNPPFGYELGPDRLYVPGKHAALVSEVFRKRTEGWGWRKLARYLDKQAPRANGKRWATSAIQRMIANRVYLGEAFHGEHRNLHAHQPLVTEVLFNAANEVRGVSLTPHEGRKQVLLRGLIRCASCRYCLHEGWSRRAGDSNGKKYRIYRHVGPTVAGPCPDQQSVIVEKVEQFVVETWKQEMRRLRLRAVPSSDDLAEAQRGLEAAQAELTVFTADVEGASRLRGVGAYDDALEARVSAVEAAEQRVVELAQPLEEMLDGLDLSSWQWDVDAWWGQADFETRRRALTSSIDAIMLRGPGRGELPRRVKVLWRGQAPDDLPRRGRDNGPMRGFTWDD